MCPHRHLGILKLSDLSLAERRAALQDHGAEFFRDSHDRCRPDGLGSGKHDLRCKFNTAQRASGQSTGWRSFAARLGHQHQFVRSDATSAGARRGHDFAQVHGSAPVRFAREPRHAVVLVQPDPANEVARHADIERPVAGVRHHVGEAVHAQKNGMTAGGVVRIPAT